MVLTYLCEICKVVTNIKTKVIKKNIMILECTECGGKSKLIIEPLGEVENLGFKMANFTQFDDSIKRQVYLWQHIYPVNEEHLHNTNFNPVEKEFCACNFSIDFDNFLIIHERIGVGKNDDKV